MRVLLLALAALAACSSDPAPPRACTPGAQVSCACPGGAAGVQVCAADGLGLGACACPDAGGSSDAAAEAAVDAPAAGPDAADVPPPPPDAPAPPEAAVDVAPEASGPCVDTDGDGYGTGCAAGPDCDDTTRSRRPGATELCNGLDDNCDGVADGYPDGRHDPAADAWCTTRGLGTMHACELATWTPAQQRCSPGPAGARAWCVWVDRLGDQVVSTTDSGAASCPRR